MQYPIAWNASQNWNFSLTGTKATLHLIYEHRYFFQGNTQTYYLNLFKQICCNHHNLIKSNDHFNK